MSETQQLHKSKAVDPINERAVLAGIFKYGGDLFVEIADLLETETFTVYSNQVIWAIFKSIFDRNLSTKLDIPTIYAEASSLGLAEFLQTPVEKRHLDRVIQWQGESENIKDIAKRIRKQHVARILQDQARKVIKSLDTVKGDEDVQDIISRAESPIFDTVCQLQSTASNDIKHIGDGIDEYIENIELHPNKMVGISTGYPNYDAAIGGGLRRGSVNIVGARLKVGKSSWLDSQ